MAQDLRNLFEKEDKVQNVKMSEGHEARFLQKLDEELPRKKTSNRFNFLNIAASVVLLIGLSFGAFKILDGPSVTNPNQPTEDIADTKSLGELVPDLKKVEDYYVASINLELSKVELTSDNKELVDGYIERLKELNEEYDKLIKELDENGPNEETLDAIINNLKFQLNLVTQLKEKLKEFNEDTFVQESV